MRDRERQQEGGLHVPDELERGGAAAACGEGATALPWSWRQGIPCGDREKVLL